MRQIPMLALDLDGKAGSVRLARQAVQQFLDQLAAAAGPRFRDTTRLDVSVVVTELVSNACLHAPGPCRLLVAARPGEIEVAVEDTGHRLLAPSVPAGTWVRGLLVVTRLSRGVHVVPIPGGKVVETVVVER
ncbi:MULTISPECIES: ATP-binding protein [Kitasatospora]|uniref:Anti-sigma regulatory factor (Ser/Thr protein kinase) n=2 Tax=Kitasatospora TaxID=2063 RepID=A0ABT1J377_9ACTN|nr:ATP-binding protein [Kitasatospora paracochleata]MCP2311877.1 anti-sigma regulatory factor (Ser/Thr protein kinase) [Kitasatospora paracochleata]